MCGYCSCVLCMIWNVEKMIRGSGAHRARAFSLCVRYALSSQKHLSKDDLRVPHFAISLSSDREFSYLLFFRYKHATLMLVLVW